MTHPSFIVEKTSTFLDGMIHITLGCAMHLHSHQNKMVPFMKLSIFTDLSNGVKFRNCTYWSINDIHNHHFSCRVRNHHIGNKDLVLTIHVHINL